MLEKYLNIYQSSFCIHSSYNSFLLGKIARDLVCVNMALVYVPILSIMFHETHTDLNSFETIISQVKWIIQASTPIPASMMDSNSFT